MKLTRGDRLRAGGRVGDAARSTARSSASSRSRTFSPGAHAEVRRSRRTRLLHEGAQGIVLDLRGNGGGLVEEAQLIASIFIEKGTIVSTRGRTQPSQTLVAVGGAIRGSIPMVVLVDANTASAAEIVTAALQDHHRATVVGTHTFGKGVFQEEEPLSNGGALDITVGEYFTPERPQPRRRRRQAGRGYHPRSEGHERRRRTARPDVALETLRRKVEVSAAGGAREPLVAVLRRRGRFLSAEPLFAPSRARPGRGRAARAPRRAAGIVVGPARGSRAGAGEGDIALVAPGRRGSSARVLRRIGRPDVARDVIEALLLDRGLRRGFAASAEARSRGGRRAGHRRAARAAARPARARDLHDRSRQRTRLRRRDLGARRWGTGGVRVWVHIADVARARARGLARSTARRASARRASTCPAPSSRCCRTRSRATRARCAPASTAAAVTVEIELDGRGGREGGLLPLADPLRRAAGLRPRRPRSSPAASGAAEPWAAPLRAARGVRGGARARAAQRERRAGDRLARARVRASTSGATSWPSRPRADRVPPPDRAPDDRRQRGGRAASCPSARSPCLYRVHERPDPERVAAAGRAARLAGGADPAAARADVLDPGGRASLGALSLRVQRARRARTGPRPDRARLACPALAQAGVLLAASTSATPACARRPTATSPRRSAAIPTSSATARCSSALGGGERAAARRRSWPSSARGPPSASATRCSSSATPTTSRRCFALERLLREEGPGRVFEGEITGLISAGAFVAFAAERPRGRARRPPFEGLLPVRLLRAPKARRSGPTPRGAPGAGARRSQRGGRAGAPAQRRLARAARDERARLVGAQRAGHDPARRAHRRGAAARRPPACEGRRGSRPFAAVSTSSRQARLAGVAKGKGKRKVGAGDVASNRYASYRYELIERHRVRDRARGHRGQGAAHERRAAEGRLRGAARRRAVAALGAHPAVRARPRARTTTPSARASCCCTGASSTGSRRASNERGLTLVPDADLLLRARTRRSRSRSRAARTSTTSARRSASARPSATSNAACAKRSAEPRAQLQRAEAVAAAG